MGTQRKCLILSMKQAFQEAQAFELKVEGHMALSGFSKGRVSIWYLLGVGRREMEARREGGDGRGKAWTKARRENDGKQAGSCQMAQPSHWTVHKEFRSSGSRARLRSLDFNF